MSPLSSTVGNKRMNLYLDIDGVILGTNPPTSQGVVLARHAADFLAFAVERFDCFWLSTHCKGDVQPVIEYLRPHVAEGMVPLLRHVGPTSFDVLKTEALRGDFYWIDDSPLQAELAWLATRGMLDRWICVNTRQRPEDLLSAMNVLRAALEQPTKEVKHV